LNGSTSNVYYLQNSADYRHFVKSADTELEIPGDIKLLPRPRLGFIGNINHLIDYELLAKLSGEFTNGAIVMIGGEQKNSGITRDRWYQKTKTNGNVHYLGFHDYEKLPNYLKGFDVCLMPFRLNDWMRYSAPNKTYQYLASGKPIVSTDFPEVHHVEQVVHIAKNHTEFIEMVRRALNDKSDIGKAARQQVAFENSTEKWAEKVMEILNKSLTERKPFTGLS
jgi:glycosyltransferase involved in cell wall biosynthesis